MSRRDPREKRDKKTLELLAELASGMITVYGLAFITLVIIRRIGMPISNDATWIGSIIATTALLNHFGKN